MARGRRYQRRQQGLGATQSMGIKNGRPLQPRGYAPDATFMNTSIPIPPNFTPPALEGMHPTAFFRPQASGPPTPVWSPGPIPDFYNQREEIDLNRIRNSAVHYPHLMQLGRSPQPDQSRQHHRPVPAFPQIRHVHPIPPVQPVQLVTPMHPIHSIPPSHSMPPSQYNQPVPPSLPHIPLQPASYIQHVPVPIAVPYLAGLHPVQGPGQDQTNGVGTFCAPEITLGNMGSQFNSQLRADAPEFVPWEQSETNREKPKKFNWMVVTST
ncbi:hypothetical protein BBP40_006591 [Aspergillus hancockii]|nr:hypothetical protein BBP40_006591 [Aspergillus hancockii]